MALNASGRAGAGMTREALIARGLTEIPINGAEPITVPGALSGWAALLRRYGTITLAEALQPAIQLAERWVPGLADHRESVGRRDRAAEAGRGRANDCS